MINNKLLSIITAVLLVFTLSLALSCTKKAQEAGQDTVDQAGERIERLSPTKTPLRKERPELKRRGDVPKLKKLVSKQDA
jgi:hypothetical protein